MFTSRRLAPPRTCSSATSTAPAEVVGLDEPPEARRAGDVRPLADHHEAGVGPDLERLQPAEARRRTSLRDLPRGQSLGQGHDGLDVLGRRAAAAADEVHEPVRARTRAGSGSCPSGSSSCAPNSFGRPAFGMARDVRRRDAREVLDERPHLLRAERAVDADDERLRVLDRRPERLDRLPREVAPAQVDRRERDPERQLAAPPPARRRSRPSRSACRRSSRSAAGRRRPRRARPSARRTPRAPRRT